MFGGSDSKSKLKVSKTVYDKVRVAAQIAGCADADELVEQILLREAEKIIASTSSSNVSAEDVEEITNQLKGLGYLE